MAASLARSQPGAARAFALYALLSAAILARGVVAAPGSTVIGDRGADKTIFMWSFVWWPRAILNGQDPFVSHAVWAPHGIDLSWVTSVPGPSVMASPLTWLAGPIVTYNVLAVLAPVLAAWAMFLLARWVTKSFWPSLVAGYIFGFSAYEIAQTQGHLNLTLVFLVPLVALLVLRRFRGELARARFITLLALALALQLLISAEVFTTTLIVAMLVGLLAVWRLPVEGRRQLLVASRESAVALGACGMLSLPYLIHAFLITGPSYAPERSPFSQAADLLNFIVPGHSTWLRPPGSSSIASNFTANPVEAGAYLGVPLVVILVLAALRQRDRVTSFLLLALVTVAVCALGSRIRLSGHAVLPGPWELPAKLPVTRAILPVRLSVFVALLAALVCARWLAQRPDERWRWVLALLAVVAIFPNPSRAFWTSDVRNPIFFRTDASKGMITAEDTAVVFPFGKAGWSMLWQAENQMRYRMAGGYLGNRPPEEDRWTGFLRALVSGRRMPPDATITFRKFLQAHNVSVVVVAPGTRPSLRRLVRTLPVRPARHVDVLIYRLDD